MHSKKFKVVVKLLFIYCIFLKPLLCVGFVFGACFVVQYLVLFCVLQSFGWGKGKMVALL